jgi:hypothetical protein
MLSYLQLKNLSVRTRARLVYIVVRFYSICLFEMSIQAGDRGGVVDTVDHFVDAIQSLLFFLALLLRF